MFIPDVYKDVSYVLDDDSYASAEYNDIVRKRFVKAWESLVEGYKVGYAPRHRPSHVLTSFQDTFTESNFRLFFGLALDVLVRPWEKFVMALKYTEVCSISLSSSLISSDLVNSSVQFASIATCAQSRHTSRRKPPSETSATSSSVSNRSRRCSTWTR